MIPLVDKNDMIKSKRILTKSKSTKYGYMKKNAQELAIKVLKAIEKEGQRDVFLKTREVAKEFGIADRSDATVYAGLRYLLFFEGLSVSTRFNGVEEILRVGPINGSGYQLPKSYIAAYDKMELDGWYLKRAYDCLTAKYSIRKNDHKDNDGMDTYTLESEGDVTFDRRDLTEAQAVDFVKYMSSGGIQAPDVVSLTPINLVIPDRYLTDARIYTDFDKIGREFRIVRSGNIIAEYIVMSIYGKECTVFEHDIDSLVKGCSVIGLLRSFEQGLMVEKIPERVEILKKLLPEIKTKNSAIIDGRKLLITNSVGTFQLSLMDGTLHKIYDVNSNTGNKYICVGPRGESDNSIIFNGQKYQIDRIMGAIISKAVMLLEEKYPDARTISQIMN